MTRIHTSLERWRYNIGLITSTTLIAQLLATANGQPIEPIEGMGDAKQEIRSQDAVITKQSELIESKEAEIRSQAETIDVQQRKLDEEQAKLSELQEEVERLESTRNNRSNSDNSDVRVRNVPSDKRQALNVEATFYTAFCSTGCTGITATGLDVSSSIYTPEGLRVIAVDPAVIKLGSKVRVTLTNGESFVAKAEDTGGDIRGNRIDVLVSDEATAYSLGRQAATVEVISE